jgi:hypothetical protein
MVLHHAEPASPGERRRDRLDHVVRRHRERYDLVDARRDMATRTPRAVRGRLVACLEYSGGDQHQRLVWHLPLGLGLLDLAGLQRRHRARRVLRLILDFRYGATVARRSVRLPTPMERGACAHGQCATRHAPLHRHGRGHLFDGIASNILLNSNPLDRTACERHRRSLQRPCRRVPHHLRPALRRLDRDHLDQATRPRPDPKTAIRSPAGGRQAASDYPRTAFRRRYPW